VPGGGLSPEGYWINCRPGFFLPVRVLSRLYRRLFMERLCTAFDAGTLGFFGELAGLATPAAFAAHLLPLHSIEWVVYAKRPFGGPQQVLDYLGRYTHRVAIANSRLIALAEGQVRFRWKDYRHPQRPKVMSLAAGEFIRRFLLHVLPDGFRRIRHFGFLPTHTAAPSSPRSVARSISLNPREHPNPPIIVSVMPGSLGGHSTSARPAADTSSKSPCSGARRGRRPGPSLATAHERGVGPRLPLPINRAAVRRCDAVVAFGNPCRDRRCQSAPRYPLLGHGGHRAAKRACYRDRANRPLAPSPPASSDPPPGPTPIGSAAQRGFVQSGFNDVPHHANPDDYLAGPR